jgi:hypothetical protein
MRCFKFIKNISKFKYFIKQEEEIRASIVQSVQSLGYGLTILGSNPGSGKRFFLFSTVSKSPLEPTQPPIQWVLGALTCR